MSIEMKMMCEKVQPQPGSKKRRFEGDPFENRHSSNFAAAQRYICSKQTPANHPAPEERYNFSFFFLLSVIVKAELLICKQLFYKHYLKVVPDTN